MWYALVFAVIAVVVIAVLVVRPAKRVAASSTPKKPTVKTPAKKAEAPASPKVVTELPPEPPPKTTVRSSGELSELSELVAEVEAQEAEEKKIELETFPLIEVKDLPKERKEEYIALAEKLPRPPSLVHDIIEEVFEENYEPQRFAEIVERDPILTGKLIKTVNSAEFALRSSITSVDRAVTYLGHNVVKHITLKLLLDNVFTPPKGKIKLGFKKLWAASFIASSIATVICKEKNRVDGPVVSTISMLTYLGNFLILTGYPDKMKDYFDDTTFWDRVKLEQGRLGVNSAVIGGLLARRWDYPEILRDGIENSLIPLAFPPEEFKAEGLERTAIAWAACRLGDLVAFNNLTDIREVRFKPEKYPEHYYMERWLAAAGLDDLLLTIFQPIPMEEINKAIQAAESI